MIDVSFRLPDRWQLFQNGEPDLEEVEAEGLFIQRAVSLWNRWLTRKEYDQMVHQFGAALTGEFGAKRLDFLRIFDGPFCFYCSSMHHWFEMDRESFFFLVERLPGDFCFPRVYIPQYDFIYDGGYAEDFTDSLIFLKGSKEIPHVMNTVERAGLRIIACPNPQ